MAKSATKAKNPLYEKYQYTGKIYRLSGEPTVFDYEELASGLRQKKIYTELNYDEDEKITVPEVFQTPGGTIETMTNFNPVEVREENGLRIVTGFVILDDPNEINFRDQRVLVMNTSEVRFAIFGYDGDHFLVMMGSRELVDGVLEIIRGDLDDLGVKANPVNITPQGIENIADSLADVLLDTTFEDYPQTTIDKKRIWGRGYRDDPEYQEEKDRGKVRGHMMATTELADEREKVISISDDGLVRSYSNMMLLTYLKMIRDYILPNALPQYSLSDFQSN